MKIKKPTILFLLFLFSVLQIAAQTSSKFELEKLNIEVEGESSPAFYYSIIQTKESPNSFLTYMYENVYERFGAKREYFEPLVLTTDLLLLKNYLEDQGYFNSKIDTSLTLDFKNNSAKLSIKINEGKQSIVDSFQVAGFENIDEETNKLIYSNFIFKEGEFYNREKLDLELTRINKICFDNGYRLNKLDTVIQLRYLSTNNLSIIFKFNPGLKYKFGKIILRGDTLNNQSEIIFRHIDFKQGDVYNESTKLRSDQNLNQLGIFEFVRIEVLPPQDSTSDNLPVIINYKTNTEFREIVPEVLVNDENNTLNTGVGLSFNHKNFFGDARKFTTKFRFTFQSLPYLDVKRALERGINEPTLLTKTDLNFLLIQPYFFSTRTSSALDGMFEYDNKQYYTLNTLRSRFGIIHQFANYTKGFLDYNVERVSIESIDTTKVNLNYFTGRKQKQFNSMVSFTIQRDKTDDLIYPSKGFFHLLQIEEAGSFSRVFKNLSKELPYSEYVRLNITARHFFDLSAIPKMSVFAFKLKTGISYLYNPNNTTPVPPSRKFYAGGSTSNRGWKSRSLSSFANPEQGGNILFETGTEFRFQLFSEPKEFMNFDLQKIGLTFFTDAGTIWDSLKSVKISDIAISSGIGFRYNTIVGPIRIDFGVRIYDPHETPDNRWILNRFLFKNAYSRIEIGLGHTF